MAIIEPIFKRPSSFDDTQAGPTYEMPAEYVYQIPKGSRVTINAQPDNGYGISGGSMLFFEGSDSGIGSGLPPEEVNSPYTISAFNKTSSVVLTFDGDGPTRPQPSVDNDIRPGNEVRLMSQSDFEWNLKIVVETNSENISYVYYTRVEYNKLFDPLTFIQPFERMIGRTIPRNTKYENRSYGSVYGSHETSPDGAHLVQIYYDDLRVNQNKIFYDASLWPEIQG